MEHLHDLHVWDCCRRWVPDASIIQLPRRTSRSFQLCRCVMMCRLLMIALLESFGMCTTCTRSVDTRTWSGVRMNHGPIQKRKPWLPFFAFLVSETLRSRFLNCIPFATASVLWTYLLVTWRRSNVQPKSRWGLACWTNSWHQVSHIGGTPGLSWIVMRYCCRKWYLPVLPTIWHIITWKLIAPRTRSL